MLLGRPMSGALFGICLGLPQSVLKSTLPVPSGPRLHARTNRGKVKKGNGRPRVGRLVPPHGGAGMNDPRMCVLIYYKEGKGVA